MTTRRRKKHGPEEMVAKLRDAEGMLNASTEPGHGQPRLLKRPEPLPQFRQLPPISLPR
jgi:hypothetical protein